MLVKTSAVVLHSFRYGETSKIVRLLTQDHGVQSALAKGALREKSKFGGKLEVLSRGVAHIYMKPTRDLQTLGEFEVEVMRRSLTRDLAKFASAAVMAELLVRCSPPDAQPELYRIMEDNLDELQETPTELGAAVGVAGVWRLVAGLGYSPGLGHCIVDGTELAAGTAAFSPRDGGFVCPECARERRTTRVPERERSFVEAVLAGGALPERRMDDRTALAHRRLVRKFLLEHVTEGRELRSLDYWETA